MASKRLNKADRTEIFNAVMLDASKERMEALMAREHQIGKQVYLKCLEGFGKHVQAVPEDFYQKGDCLTVKLYNNAKDEKLDKNHVSYKRCTLETDYQSDRTEPRYGKYYHASDDIELGEEVRVPHGIRYGWVAIQKKTTLGQEVLALVAAQEKLYDDLKKLAETINAAMVACTTVKKLVDDYPELKKYAPSDIANTSLAVPHGKIKDLIACTKDDDCPAAKKARKAKKGEVIAL